MTRSISILAMVAAGVIHMVLAPDHYSHAPAHGIFFAIAGAVEMLWAIAFWRRTSRGLYAAGLAIAGGLIVLWAITRFAPAPFEGEPGLVDAGGILCKLSELAGFGALVGLALQGQVAGSARQSNGRVIASALALALISGIAAYGLGFAAEPLFPSLAGQDHGHEEGGAGGHPAEGAEQGHLSGDEHSSIEGQITIEHPWGRPGAAGQDSAVYFTIHNPAGQADHLLGVATEVTPHAELHRTAIDANGVASMSHQDAVEIPAGSEVEFAPGGLHVMLAGLAHDLQPGDTFPLTLTFEHAGEVTVQVEVETP
jgi:copper(I)-binding protein